MRTQHSTTEINNLLSQLQSESSVANMAMIKSSTLSDNCVQLAGETGESLQNIIVDVNKLADLNTQIATAIEEQSLVSEEINTNIVAISDLAASTNEHGQNSVELSSELLDKLEEQQALVNQFV